MCWCKTPQPCVQERIYANEKVNEETKRQVFWVCRRQAENPGGAYGKDYCTIAIFRNNS